MHEFCTKPLAALSPPTPPDSVAFALMLPYYIRSAVKQVVSFPIPSFSHSLHLFLWASCQTQVLLDPQASQVVVQVAGTEQGVTEPEATFSACFGGAFLMWHPMKYASMLAEKMEEHGTRAWLVNTGWTGGR